MAPPVPNNCFPSSIILILKLNFFFLKKLDILLDKNPVQRITSLKLNCSKTFN